VGACECGLIRTLDPPADYSDLYTVGNTYHEGRNGHVSYKERYSHDYGVAMQRFGKFLGQLRWLDVGCANGAFVAMLVDQGIRADGLEINPIMAKWSETITHARIHTNWNQVFGTFDVISLHDVIEHIPNPRAELEHIKQHLQPGGFVILDTPDTSDPRFKELQLNWHHMKPREHLWFFNQSTLSSLLDSAGFRVWSVDRPIQGKLVLYGRLM
jgi:SAM-dependent methyltransferase